MAQYSINVRGVNMTRTKLRNNIVKVLNAAKLDKETFERSMWWYDDAKAFAQSLVNDNKHGYTIHQVIGVISALSPLKSWRLNCKLAEDWILNNRRGGHTAMQCSKAEAILKTKSEDDIIEILGGQKTQNFYLNIMYPQQDIAVTIDRHAIGVAYFGVDRKSLKPQEQQVTSKQFEFLVSTYKWAGEQFGGLSAVQIQAITWEYFRKLKAK